MLIWKTTPHLKERDASSYTILNTLSKNVLFSSLKKPYQVFIYVRWMFYMRKTLYLHMDGWFAHEHLLQRADTSFVVAGIISSP